MALSVEALPGLRFSQIPDIHFPAIGHNLSGITDALSSFRSRVETSGTILFEKVLDRYLRAKAVDAPWTNALDQIMGKISTIPDTSKDLYLQPEMLAVGTQLLRLVGVFENPNSAISLYLSSKSKEIGNFHRAQTVLGDRLSEGVSQLLGGYCQEPLVFEKHDILEVTQRGLKLLKNEKESVFKATQLLSETDPDTDIWSVISSDNPHILKVVSIFSEVLLDLAIKTINSNPDNGKNLESIAWFFSPAIPAGSSGGWLHSGGEKSNYPKGPNSGKTLAATLLILGILAAASYYALPKAKEATDLFPGQVVVVKSLANPDADPSKNPQRVPDPIIPSFSQVTPTADKRCQETGRFQRFMEIIGQYFDLPSNPQFGQYLVKYCQNVRVIGDRMPELDLSGHYENNGEVYSFDFSDQENQLVRYLDLMNALKNMQKFADVGCGGAPSTMQLLTVDSLTNTIAVCFDPGPIAPITDMTSSLDINTDLPSKNRNLLAFYFKLDVLSSDSRFIDSAFSVFDKVFIINPQPQDPDVGTNNNIVLHSAFLVKEGGQLIIVSPDFQDSYEIYLSKLGFAPYTGDSMRRVLTPLQYKYIFGLNFASSNWNSRPEHKVRSYKILHAIRVR